MSSPSVPKTPLTPAETKQETPSFSAEQLAIVEAYGNELIATLKEQGEQFFLDFTQVKANLSNVFFLGLRDDLSIATDNLRKSLDALVKKMAGKSLEERKRVLADFYTKDLSKTADLDDPTIPSKIASYFQQIIVSLIDMLKRPVLPTVNNPECVEAVAAMGQLAYDVLRKAFPQDFKDILYQHIGFSTLEDGELDQAVHPHYVTILNNVNRNKLEQYAVELRKNGFTPVFRTLPTSLNRPNIALTLPLTVPHVESKDKKDAKESKSRKLPVFQPPKTDYSFRICTERFVQNSEVKSANSLSVLGTEDLDQTLTIDEKAIATIASPEIPYAAYRYSHNQLIKMHASWVSLQKSLIFCNKAPNTEVIFWPPNSAAQSISKSTTIMLVGGHLTTGIKYEGNQFALGFYKPGSKTLIGKFIPSDCINVFSQGVSPTPSETYISMDDLEFDGVNPSDVGLMNVHCVNGDFNCYPSYFLQSTQDISKGTSLRLPFFKNYYSQDENCLPQLRDKENKPLNPNSYCTKRVTLVFPMDDGVGYEERNRKQLLQSAERGITVGAIAPYGKEGCIYDCDQKQLISTLNASPHKWTIEIKPSQYRIIFLGYSVTRNPQRYGSISDFELKTGQAIDRTTLPSHPKLTEHSISAYGQGGGRKIFEAIVPAIVQGNPETKESKSEIKAGWHFKATDTHIWFSASQAEVDKLEEKLKAKGIKTRKGFSNEKLTAAYPILIVDQSPSAEVLKAIKEYSEKAFNSVKRLIEQLLEKNKLPKPTISLLAASLTQTLNPQQGQSASAVSSATTTSSSASSGGQLQQQQQQSPQQQQQQLQSPQNNGV